MRLQLFVSIWHDAIKGNYVRFYWIIMFVYVFLCLFACAIKILRLIKFLWNAVDFTWDWLRLSKRYERIQAWSMWRIVAAAYSIMTDGMTEVLSGVSCIIDCSGVSWWCTISRFPLYNHYGEVCPSIPSSQYTKGLQTFRFSVNFAFWFHDEFPPR